MAKNYIPLNYCQVANSTSKEVSEDNQSKTVAQIALSLRNIAFTLSLILSVFLSQEVSAQANTYVFAQSNGTYTPITGGTLIVVSTGNVPPIDSYASGVLTIPSFTFAGTAYTQMSVTSNGQLALGGSTPSASNYDALSATTGGNVFLAPFSADLNSNTTSTGEIRYEIIGNEIIVQWTNFQRYGVTENISFQVRMNKITGQIKFVYDGTPPYGTATTYQPQVGIKSAVGNYSALTVASGGSWNTPVKITTGISSSSICRFTSTTGPTTGLTYTWSPDVPGFPNCATSFVPANSSNAVAISPTLTWSSGGGVPTSYDVYFGTSTNPPLVTTQSGTTYSPGTLLVNTNYYWKIVPKNSFGLASSCTENTFKTGSGVTYCTPSSTANGTYISNFSTSGGSTNITNASGYTSGGYQDNFGGAAVTVIPSGSFNYNFTVVGGTVGAAIWIDWNSNGAFESAERVFVTTSYGSGPFSGSIIIPGGTPSGNYRMRVMVDYIVTAPSDPCKVSTGRMEAEDYKITVGVLAPCTGTPDAGSLSVNPTTGQPGSAYAVSASGFTGASGLTFQWQYSDNGGGAWTNQGGTSSSYTNLTGMIAPAFGVVRTWHLVVTCTGFGSTANSSTATFTSSYCTPSSTANGTYISNFSTSGGSTNITNASGYTSGGYQDNFGGAAVTVIPSGSFNYNFTVVGGTLGAAIWIDWNNDGIFQNPAERVFASSIYGDGPFSGTITVPGGAASGNYRMRVMVDYNNSAPSNPCMTANARTETEDYKITVGIPPPCVAPTAQPTALSLSVSGSIISGSFTASVPTANSYLVVASTNPSPPTPVNSTTYVIGGTVGAGYIVADIDSNTTFSTPSLLSNTLHYIYVFSMNNYCTGGPLYNKVSPLSGNATTANVSYCVPLVSNTYQDDFYTTRVRFLSALSDVSNTSGYSSSPLGYQDWSSKPKSSQAQGEYINVSVDNNSSTTIIAWVDWNKDGNFAASEKVYDTDGNSTAAAIFGFLIPVSQAIGDYRIRIRSHDPDKTYPYTACQVLTNESGETEDYLFTVVAKCSSLITSVIDGVGCGTSSTVELGAVATAGVTQFKWYTVATGGAAVGTSPAVANATTWVTPVISTTTNYYVTASNGSCESLVRTLVIAKLTAIPVVTFTPAIAKICGDEDILQLTAASNSKEIVHLIKENFEAGGLGSFSALNIINNSTVDNQTIWQNRSSTFTATGDFWKPAISSGLNGNKFAMTTSDVGDFTVNNALVSPLVSVEGFTNLTLKFDLYYSRYYPADSNNNLDYVLVEYSVDGGANWLSTAQLKFVVDVGSAAKFVAQSFDLSALTGQPNLRIRFRYYAEWCDGVAIDNIELFGDKEITAFKFDTSSAAAFTDSAATIPYVSGTSATSLFVKPTLTQLESAVITIPVSTLSNICGPSVNITNNTKSFSAGMPASDWNTASNWKPAGVPTATNCVIILDEDVQVTAASVGLKLAIKNGALLEVNSGKSILITDKVTIESGGELRLKDGASLLQTNDVANSGLGQMKMERTANIRKLDYVYWSSPVTTASAFSSASISAGTSSGLIYKWLPTIAGNVNGFGNWTSGLENMISGKGYIVRGPDLYSNTPANFTTTFAGTPSNGSISIPIVRGGWNGGNYSTTVSTTPGTNEDDNWNLVGNPYPSAIKALDFLTANDNIDGFINIWTHGSMPDSTIADPFYDSFSYNYNLSDYITYNASGSSTGPGSFNGFIPAGQGFFVAMLHSSPTPGNLNFTNALRSTAYNNGVFYKAAAEQSNEEEGRIWLDIIAEDGSNVRTLIAYVEGATNDRDRLYDALTDNKENLNLFSNIGEDIMKIQGRQIPFEQTDMVSMGIKVPTNGIYSIAIAAVDGLFESAVQNIYLEDKNTGIIHNLKESPYSFSAESGIDSERFVLRYSNETLGNANFENDSPAVLIASADEIQIKSTLSEIKSVRVFDVLGRQLAYYSTVNNYDLTLSNFRKLNSTLIIQVTLENGLVVNKKIIY